jgi:hypothetical protein
MTTSNQVVFADPANGPLTALETTPGDPSTVELLNAAGQVVSNEPDFDGAPPAAQGYIITPSDGAFFLDGTYIELASSSTTDIILSELNQFYLTYGSGTPYDQSAINSVESGFVGHEVQALTFNSQGLLIEPTANPPPPPTPTTTDYTPAQLSSLLTNILNPTDLSHILNHFPNGAIVETDTDGPYNPLPDVTDASGNQPNLLLLDASGNTIDLDNFSSVHNIVQQNTDILNHLILDGTGENEHLYLQPGGQYVVDDNMSNNKLTTLDSRNAGVTLNIDATNQTLVAKSGGNIIKVNWDSSNIILDAAGGYNTIDVYGGAPSVTANGGHSNINLNGNDYDMTLHIGGGTNIVTIGEGQHTLYITGISSTDMLYFTNDQTFSSAEITEAFDTAGNKITEVSFVGQSGVTTLNGWHDAVHFAGDPSIHYI